MLASLAFVLVSTATLQGRAFAFLSYQDTIFAVRKRDGWAAPSRQTELPRDEIELVALGLSSVRTRELATVENWDGKSESWLVACANFDQVMGWCVEPRYPRRLRRRPDMALQATKIAQQIYKSKGVTPTSMKTPQVYSVDLGGNGTEECVADVSCLSQGHAIGLAFMFYDSSRFQSLELCRDGWPRILSVAALDDDRVMEVIVGGTTLTGKCISMWKYDQTKLKPICSYQAPR